ncbi:MAG: hypothetical protein DRP42_07060 [Tenericutes bacterium]|nr:MAG: hypothetical protein DRP42_07060 [Mycoplasmatota bacterium]
MNKFVKADKGTYVKASLVQAVKVYHNQAGMWIVATRVDTFAEDFVLAFESKDPAWKKAHEILEACSGGEK